MIAPVFFEDFDRVELNFPPKQIGPARSEVLVLGVPDGAGQVALVVPDREVPLGGRMF